MKKVTTGALIVLILLIVGLTVGAYTNGAPSLVYVYSDSMEPLIQVNDAFLIWPLQNPRPGDIVVYRPVVLEAPYITHRIIGIKNKGFITQGDNSLSPDQDIGEPPVEPSRIIGRVVTYQGQPLIIPQLGRISAGLKGFGGDYSKWLAAGMLGLGLLNLAVMRKSEVRKKKSHNRYRLKHLYKAIVIVSASLLIMSILLGARVNQIKYLVSEDPTNLNEQIELRTTGTLTLKLTNNGIVPIIPVVVGIYPFSTQSDPLVIGPLSSTDVELSVSPQNKIGVYYGYVQVFKYPALMPKDWLVELHRQSPYLAIGIVSGEVALFFTLLLFGLSKLPGFGSWIPLKAIQDKVLSRRVQRMKAKVWAGRRRKA